MVKQGRGRGRGKGRGRGRGNAAAVGGVQAKGTPSKQESETKQEQPLEFANESAFMACAPLNVADIPLPPESPPPNLTNAKKVQSSDLKTQKVLKTHDSMPLSQDLEESDKQQLNLDLKASKEHEELSSDSDKKATETRSAEDVSMTVSQDSEASEKQQPNLDLKTSKEHAEFSSDSGSKATETKSAEDVSITVLQNSEESEKQQPNLDPKASKEHEEFSSDSDNKATETKSMEDVSMTISADSEESEKKQPNLDLKASKEHEEFSSDSDKKGTETKSVDNVSMTVSQDSDEFEKQQPNLDLKASKERDEFSSDNEKKPNETKFEDVSMPVSQDSEESDKQEPNLDLNASKERDEFSSDSEKKSTETKSGEDVSEAISQDSEKKELNLGSNASKESREFPSDAGRARSKADGKQSLLMLLGSKDVDCKKLDLEISHVQQELTESQFPVNDESWSSLQDSNLTALKEMIQNLNLNASDAKRDSSSEKQNDSSESQIKQTVNVVKGLNLRFDSYALGNKKILVDNEKKEYIVDKKKKITFNIRDSNVKVSFEDNKISIFAERGQIECSTLENEVSFVIKASASKPEPTTESPNTTELPRIKDKEAVEDLAIPNATGITKQDSLHPSEEISDECGTKNVDISTQKADSLVPRSEVQEMLRSRTDAFLTNLSALCKDYESDFLKCLNKEKEGSNE